MNISVCHKINQKNKKHNTKEELIMAETIVMTINGVDVICEFKVTKEEKESLIRNANNKSLVRYLIDQYEQSQAYRIRGENQIRSFSQGYDTANNDGIEHEKFIEKQMKLARVQEAMNKRYMDIITNELPFCQWAKSICGIGPVLSAYLFATFDIGNGRYATDFCSYAGLNDNRNPWLGEAKGTALAKEAQKFALDKINTELDPIFTAYKESSGDKSMKKLMAKLKKIDHEGENLISDVRSVISGLVSDDTKIVSEMLNVIGSIGTSSISEYVLLCKSASACTTSMIQYAAEQTGRKPVNVAAGVRHNLEVKKNKSSVMTVGDLGSYLAKPPYNRDTKKRMYQIGESFVKQSHRPKSLYGRLYLERKAYEVSKNENGDYADQAARMLQEKNYNKETDTYKSLITGKLSPAHINMRAIRWTEKLFLSHVHEAMWWEKYHDTPPQPYIVAYGNHHDYVAPEVDYRKFIA